MNTRHSGYVMPMNNYVDLEQYNKDTQFGPPLHPHVPSANFPTILEQKSNADTLPKTLRSDGGMFGLLCHRFESD